MSLRERALLHRLRERDEDAFTEVVRVHQNQVFNLIYRMIGSREEAQDVAQEVFITLFKTIDQFRGDSKLSTWLYRIAANHCKNRIRYLARRRGSANGLDDLPEGSLADRGQAPVQSHVARPDA